MLAQQLALRTQAMHPSGEYAEITRPELEQSVLTRFDRIVAAFPNSAAMVDPSRTMTYAELDLASNRVSRAIHQRRSQINQPVAILMENGVDLATVVYGATKAGMCYVMLPPETPAERLSFMLHDLGNPLLLADNCNLELARSVVSIQSDLLAVGEALEFPCAEPLGLAIGPDTRYFIRYTSGSTGRPKGVVSTHRDFLLHSRNLIKALQLCRQDRRAAFGNNASAVITTTLAGATFYEFGLRKSGANLVAKALADKAITILGCTVTTFRQLVRSADRYFTYPNLRMVLLHGEAPTPQDIVTASNVLSPTCVFNNQYGTTESWIATTYYASVESATGLDSLPAGYAAEDMEVLLWDETEQQVADGEIGEIVVRSRYLNQGYWNRPKLTSARFRPDPDGGDRRLYCTGDLGRRDPDGCLHYMGRKDQQVKIRGHRIEIPEVEAELLALDGVKMAAVDARPGPGDDLRLVAYIVPERDEPLVSTIRQALGERLPAHMVPAAYVFLEELPLTTSQKVDRRSLPDPGRERPPLAEPYVAPHTPLETTLAKIWADVLGLDKVGICDSFLDLGGNSLLASQVVTRVIQTLRVDVSLGVIFAAPTVADMALAVTEALLQTASDETIVRLLAEIGTETET